MCISQTGSSSSNHKASGAPPTFLVKYRDPIRLATCASGICGCFWLYGFLQEKILFQSELGAIFILVNQTVTNIMVALVWRRFEESSESTAKPAGGNLHHALLALTSATYVFAMSASNEALEFVSYPTAVLAKSCKIIPTMVMGWAIERRKYAAQQWIAALFISFGIAVFNLSRVKEPAASAHGQHNTEGIKIRDPDEYWKGLVLLAISLCMDGFLGACQGFLKRKDTRGHNHRPPTAVETMLYVNMYSLLLLGPMALLCGQWNEGIRILSDDPYLLRAILILNAVVGVAQIFINLTITWYSSLVCTTITTTRKFFTILFSVLHFGHKFSSWQWLSIGMVFSGLYLSIVGNSSHAKVPVPVAPEKKTL